MAWICFLFLNNIAIVDLFWPISIFGVCLTFFLSSDKTSTNLVIISLIALWMIRLACYLFFSRIIPGHRDKRYESMDTTSHKNKRVLSFFTVFLLQAILASMVGFSFFYVSKISTTSIVYFIGVIIMIIAIVGESVSDWQLTKHKKITKQLCDKGLWALSRHPNLFFDWLFWLGVATCGISYPTGWIGLLSPICLYLIMNKITIPITEKHSLQSRGAAYLQYKNKVSCFFLWARKISNKDN